MIYILIFNIRR